MYERRSKGGSRKGTPRRSKVVEVLEEEVVEEERLSWMLR
jgi:hypothetical protein